LHIYSEESMILCLGSRFFKNTLVQPIVQRKKLFGYFGMRLGGGTAVVLSNAVIRISSFFIST
jgi:hypothetical protein